MADVTGSSMQRQEDGVTWTAGRVLCLGLALGYAIPLSLIPHEGIIDRGNYLAMAQSGPLILAGFLGEGIGAFLANEPVWFLINAVLGLFFEAEAAVAGLILVSATLAVYSVLRQSRRDLLIVVGFVLINGFLKNYVIHLRQGLAIAIFLAGYYSKRSSVRYFSCTLAAFTHSSFFFILALMIIRDVGNWMRLDPAIRLAGIGIFGLMLGALLPLVAGAVGARQAEEYEFTSAAISGIAFVFWSMMLVVLLSEGPKYIRENLLPLGGVIFYLSTYFFIEVTGRIFESILIVILISGLDLTGWRRSVFILAIFVFAGYQWLAASSRPLAGFMG